MRWRLGVAFEIFTDTRETNLNIIQTVITRNGIRYFSNRRPRLYIFFLFLVNFYVYLCKLHVYLNVCVHYRGAVVKRRDDVTDRKSPYRDAATSAPTIRRVGCYCAAVVRSRNDTSCEKLGDSPLVDYASRVRFRRQNARAQNLEDRGNYN